MPRIGIGLGLGLFGGSIDAQAQAHYNRVIADGGVVPAGVSGTNAFFNAVKSIYATSDITTAVSVGVDAHYLGYKMGAGAGATSGQAVQKLYSCAGSSGDVVQTTAASQPLLLAHNGASSDNYYYSGATNGNYVSTPDSENATFSGDLDVRVRVVNFVSNQTQVYVSKRSTSGFVFYSDTSGKINLEPWSVVSTVAVANGFSGWLRITKTSTEIKFFTGTNSDDPTFTQLGATLSGTYANPTTNSLILGIGGIYNTSTLSYFPSYCKILRVTKANSIGGTPVVDFNPATYNASTSQTQWTSTTGEVWTINTGTATTTGYKGALVDRTIVQGDGVDDRLQTNSLSAKTSFTRYIAEKYIGNAVYMISSTSNSALIYTNGSGNPRAAGSTEVVFTGTTRFTKFDLLTVNFGLSGRTQVNNANDNIGDLSTTTGVDLFLFSGSSASYMNCFINTVVETKNSIVDNATIRTAMYNYIRSINNNAF